MSRFIDEVEITVSSGNGGAGVVSFRREKYVPRGGPDGGDGGRGGSVRFRVDDRLRGLSHVAMQQRYRAADGARGAGSNRHGAAGADLILEVPTGTRVLDKENGRQLADLTYNGRTVTVCEGGRGGQGNARFATSTNRAPRMAQPGEPGTTLTLKLELSMIADIGLVGLPNAGKSSLLRALTGSNARVGSYAFTTREPNLGVMELRDRSLLLADVPGLIEGAHQGIGLGHRFLRHVQRTAVLCFVLDAGSRPDTGTVPPRDALQQLEIELREFDVALATRPRLVAANKADLPGFAETQGSLAELSRIASAPVVAVSAVSGAGLAELRELMDQLVPRDEREDRDS